MNKIVTIVLPFILVTYLIFAAGLYLFQKRIIYLPTAAVESDLVQTRVISREGIDLNLGVMNPGMPDAFIYFGGNAEATYANADAFAEWFPYHTIYLVNYRGYGGSGGEPGQQALYEDALYMVDLIRDDHQTFSAVGRSIGSAVAAHVAAQRDLHRLVLVTPFAELVSLAQSAFVVFPMQWLLTEQFQTIESIEQVDEPTLMVIAGQDEIVPAENSEALRLALVNRLGVDATIDTIPTANHNTVGDSQQYRQLLTEFLR